VSVPPAPPGVGEVKSIDFINNSKKFINLVNQGGAVIAYTNQVTAMDKDTHPQIQIGKTSFWALLFLPAFLGMASLLAGMQLAGGRPSPPGAVLLSNSAIILWPLCALYCGAWLAFKPADEEERAPVGDSLAVKICLTISYGILLMSANVAVAFVGCSACFFSI